MGMSRDGRMVIMTVCINKQLGKTTRGKAGQRNASSLQLSRRPREDRQESRPVGNVYLVTNRLERFLGAT